MIWPSDDLVALPDRRVAEVRQGGDPQGRPVLFFHGCPDSRLAAVPGDDPARAAGVRVVAVSRPGYGRSTPTASDHVSTAADVVAVADALSIGTFATLGMSVGSGYALACAALHPDRVTSSAVVSAAGDVTRMDAPSLRDDPDDSNRGLMALLARGSVDEAIALMRPDFTSYVAGVEPADADDAALAERFLAHLEDGDREIASGWGESLIAASVRESLATPEGFLRDAAVSFSPWAFEVELVRCRVGVWHGAHDRQHALHNSEWLAACLPSATLTVLPDDGHLGALHRHWSEVLSELH